MILTGRRRAGPIELILGFAYVCIANKARQSVQASDIMSMDMSAIFRRYHRLQTSSCQTRFADVNLLGGFSLIVLRLLLFKGRSSSRRCALIYFSHVSRATRLHMNVEVIAPQVVSYNSTIAWKGACSSIVQDHTSHSSRMLTRSCPIYVATGSIRELSLVYLNCRIQPSVRRV